TGTFISVRSVTYRTDESMPARVNGRASLRVMLEAGPFMSQSAGVLDRVTSAGTKCAGQAGELSVVSTLPAESGRSVIGRENAVAYIRLGSFHAKTIVHSGCAVLWPEQTSVIHSIT